MNPLKAAKNAADVTGKITPSTKEFWTTLCENSTQIHKSNMPVFCGKDKRKAPNVPGTDKLVLTENNHKLLKVHCAVCGFTKKIFLPKKGWGVGSKKRAIH